MYVGDRIRLRRVEPAKDLEDRFRWMNDPAVLKTLGMLPGRLSRDEVRQYLERTANSTADVLEFAVETLDGHHIGGTTLRNFNRFAHSAEFAIAIGEGDYRGKGYGTAVAVLMAQIGFEQLNLNRIWLHVHTTNAAGVRAYEKAGYVKEGLLRQNGFSNGTYYDSYIMAVIRSDYEERKVRA
jgi:RimJ/RimL family protein N-acetyltransferase